MLAKWMLCDVPSTQRQDFSTAQAQWSRLHGLEGFQGQCGGWDLNHQGDAALACILGLWTQAEAYQRFMSEVHDNISAENSQAQYYTSLELAFWNLALSHWGQAPDLSTALAEAQIMRVANCQVPAARQAHFERVQAEVWNPGMAQTEGLLAILFWQEQAQSTTVTTAQPASSESDLRHYLVTSFWQSRAAHEHYQHAVFPELKRLARPEDDLHSLRGHLLDLEPQWRVPATP